MKPYDQAIVRIAPGVERFFSSVFTAMEHTGLDHVKELHSQPTMIVCTHRSQTDYFVLGYALHSQGLRGLRFAAGDNLTGLPFIGPRFREYGAFTVHRDQALKRQYVRRLCERVVTMLRSGDNIIVFPEGGRSYKGSMLEMRSGILGAHIMAQHRNPETPHMILPVAISYERLPELRSFDMLLKGKRMRSSPKRLTDRLLGNLYYFGADLFAYAKMIISSKLRLRNYGSVYVDIGAPIALSDVVDISGSYNTSARDELSGHRETIQKLGGIIRTRLLGLYRILPVHILCVIVKNVNPGTSMSVEEATARVPQILTELTAQQRNLQCVKDLSPKDIVRIGMKQCRAMGGISSEVTQVRIRNQHVINYYAATIVP